MQFSAGLRPFLIAGRRMAKEGVIDVSWREWLLLSLVIRFITAAVAIAAM